MGAKLVVQTQRGETADDTGPANGIYTVTPGGDLHLLGVLPAGSISIATGVAYYVTNMSGDVYAINLDDGAPRHVRQHVIDQANGIVAVDGAVIVIGQVMGQVGYETRAIRVDLKTGALAPVALPDPTAAAATSGELEVARAGDATFVAYEIASTTLKVSNRGEIAAVSAPAGPIQCIAVTATTVWWFRQTLASQQPGALIELFSAPIKGGPAVQVPDPRKSDDPGVACAANDRELFYTKGRAIVARTADGKTRMVTTAKGELSAIAANNTAVYWAEKLPKGTWSIRSVPVN